MASAAFLIYSGIMPLIKTFLTIFCGYYLARKDMFPAAASRGASQVTMNISLPALVFANIVPAFTPQNISALGPLFLTAFVYMGIGFGMGVLIREFCYVPRNFWQGIVILSGMSNWGNLPNAVVMSVTQQSPFNPEIDPQLGVSFVSIFIVSYHLVFWVCGAAHSLSWDYLPGIPQGQDAEKHCSWREKPLGALASRYFPSKTTSSAVTPVPVISRADTLTDKEMRSEEVTLNYDANPSPALDIEGDPDVQLVRRTSHLSGMSQRSRHGPLVLLKRDDPQNPSPDPKFDSTPSVQTASRHGVHRIVPAAVVHVLSPLGAIFTPVTVAIAIALPIALVRPLKALFVDTSSMGGPDWKGPDGKPPLAFIMDTASFVGDMAIPLALILLGASFARLKVPRPLSRLPIMAMLSVALMKMVLLPVIGVFMVQGMVKGGLIDRDSKAEKFVAMFLSGTPAAVNQMIVSSLYAKDNDVDTLAAFLLVQYVFMFFSSSALTAVALLLA